MYVKLNSEVLLISLTKGTIIFVMLLLLGFTIISDEFKSEDTKITEGFNKKDSSSFVDSAASPVKESILRFTDKGKMLASWYGPKFNGKETANGELFDEMAFTAASKTLPFGTLLKLTNPRNNKSVMVRINDRGPYCYSRELDLSKGAALSLGMIKKGVLKLKVEEVTLSDENHPLIALN
jgi:rare lipoprotein A